MSNKEYIYGTFLFHNVVPALLSTRRDCLFHGNWNRNMIFQLKYPKEAHNNEAHLGLRGGNWWFWIECSGHFRQRYFLKQWGRNSLKTQTLSGKELTSTLWLLNWIITGREKSPLMVYPDIDSLLLSNPSCSVERNSGGQNITLVPHHRGSIPSV